MCHGACHCFVSFKILIILFFNLKGLDLRVKVFILDFHRDVSGVELLMNNHQSLKAEIDAREDNFTACISLGKELLSRNHYASNEIKEKLVSLTNQRNSLLHRWEERWENLQLSKIICLLSLYVETSWWRL